ncbi:MAG: GTPase HflX [Candidatus Lambdaproteobacteria bacterium]|nr:GTPase HflX [Candidatus Lambdaproteobacteria bacterium]
MIKSPLHDSKAFLLAIHTPDIPERTVAESLQELASLCQSVGGVVVGEMVQTRPRFHPGTLFGSGKLDEIKAALTAHQADMVLLDHNLSPSQGDNLERILGVLVLDRTQLILEIFGQNARTHEARLQVELAQLLYMLPRLVGLWAHLDRERGGISGSKGTGEKQINIDRTLIRNRIAQLRKELRHLAQERKTQKKRRANCFRVSLVGYTNAGKSTLMNRLTDAGVKVENRLFATLDATTRAMERTNRPHVLLTDTVGFINRLPHELVASFRSTLEVLGEADLLLQVVDVADSGYPEQIATTIRVLEDIGAQNVPRLLVFNKVDRVEDRVDLLLARKAYPDALFISAVRDDVAPLRARVLEFFERSMLTTPLQLAYADYPELSKIYRWGRVDEVTYTEDGIHLVVTATPANLERIRAKTRVWQPTATGPA